MDDDVREALDEMRDAIEALGQARTPQRRRAAQRQVTEERADLEEILREHGYRLSKKDLDDLVESREYERFRRNFDRMMEENRPDGDGDKTDDGDGDKDDKDKTTTKTKTKTATTTSGDDTEEWT